MNEIPSHFCRFFQICDFFGKTVMAHFKIQFPRAPYFFLINFELGFSVTASCIVLKLQFILLFITKSKKEKYGALEERRIFRKKKVILLRRH
jgi:hypothetical protein